MTLTIITVSLWPSVKIRMLKNIISYHKMLKYLIIYNKNIPNCLVTGENANSGASIHSIHSLCRLISQGLVHPFFLPSS